MGDNSSTCGVASVLWGYLQYCGGYSVQWADNISTMGDNISTVGDSFSTVGDSFSTVEVAQYSGG